MNVTLMTIRLRFRTTGGIGGREESTGEGEHQRNRTELRRDNHGRPHLPGTTVAGSLRAMCAGTDLTKLTELTELFGHAEENSSRGSDIQVLGTVYRPAKLVAEGAELPERTRTAVDARRGAAANSQLFTVEELPVGTEFDIMLRWDDAPEDQLTAFVDLLHRWRPTLGGGVSRGAGRCAVIGYGRKSYDLHSPDGLLAWCRDTGLGSYPQPIELAESTEPAAEPLWSLRVDIVEPLHIGSGRSTLDTKTAEKADPTQANPTLNLVLKNIEGQFLVPGSSLKGVLRSRAEYICRVVGAPACRSEKCGTCRPCRIFGFTNAKCSRRSAISVLDGTVAESRRETRTHVAIDRFTGGAKPGALYTDEVVTSGWFQLIIEQIGKMEEVDCELLAAVLTDLNDGLIGIGARTTAGYGTVHIPDWPTDRTFGDLATKLKGEA